MSPMLSRELLYTCPVIPTVEQNISHSVTEYFIANAGRFSISVDYRFGKKKSISMYLGEYYDIHMFFDGTATEGEKR